MTGSRARRLLLASMTAALVVLASLVAPTVAQAYTPTALEGAYVSRVIGGTSSCALASDTLICWGANASGTLGDGSTTDRLLAAKVDLSGTALAGEAILDVSGSGDHTCALSDTGALACWGDNQHGQLGLGTVNPPLTPAHLTPVDVPTVGTILEGKDVIDVVTQASSTCALTSDSTVACWGSNLHGVLGDGTTTDRSVPTAVHLAGGPLEGKSIVSLSGGSHHTCALTADSVIACWGAGANGQLGDGSTTDRTVPVAVTTAGTPLAGTQVNQVVTGSAHTCALTSAGYVSCWGSNAIGALGNGGGADRLVPTAVTTVGTSLEGRLVAQIAAAGQATCALAADSAVSCWGDNSNGNLGDGTRNSRSLAGPVSTSGTRLKTDPPLSVSMGECTLVATDSGAVVGWGANADGCLGDGTTNMRTKAVAAATGVATAPLPPGNVTASVTGSTVSAAWSAPIDDGGAAVTEYRVVLNLGASTVAATATVPATETTYDFVHVSAGGPYTVTVYARNSVGESAPSEPSEALAVEPPAGATTVLSAKSEAGLVAYGASTGVTTTASAAPAAFVPGLSVELWGRISGGAWLRSCSITTTSTGTGRCAVKPARTMQYQWRFYGIDGVYKPATSASITVQVRVGVSSSLSPTRIKLGRSSTFSGSLQPKQTRTKVYLQFYASGRWNNAAWTLTDSSGVYRFPVKPRKKGIYQYRAYRYGDAFLAANASSRRVLTVV